MARLLRDLVLALSQGNFRFWVSVMHPLKNDELAVELQPAAPRQKRNSPQFARMIDHLGDTIVSTHIRVRDPLLLDLQRAKNEPVGFESGNELGISRRTLTNGSNDFLLTKSGIVVSLKLGIISNVAERLEKDAVARRGVGAQPFPDDFSAAIFDHALLHAHFPRYASEQHSFKPDGGDTNCHHGRSRPARHRVRCPRPGPVRPKGERNGCQRGPGSEVPRININRTQIKGAYEQG